MNLRLADPDRDFMNYKPQVSVKRKLMQDWFWAAQRLEGENPESAAHYRAQAHRIMRELTPALVQI